MSEYPKVIRVGMLSVVVESAEEEARFAATPNVPVEIVDDVVITPEPQTYVPDAPVPVIEEPKKKAAKKK